MIRYLHTHNVRVKEAMVQEILASGCERSLPEIKRECKISWYLKSFEISAFLAEAIYRCFDSKRRAWKDQQPEHLVHAQKYKAKTSVRAKQNQVCLTFV